MDAITLLKRRSQDGRALFKRFEKAGDRAYVEKRAHRRPHHRGAVHPRRRSRSSSSTRWSGRPSPSTEDIALESLEEHHIVKWVLSELDQMAPEDERFDAKVTVLIENVRHHVKEEEDEFFPMVRDELGRNALDDLGDAMAEAKEDGADPPAPPFAPTRPRATWWSGPRPASPTASATP